MRYPSQMSEKPDILRKIDAIVGSAIRDLAATGASDEELGAFAAAHRTKVAKLLDAPLAAASEPPDIVEVVQQAVESTLLGAGLIKKKPETKKARLPAARVVLTVHGKRTTVTIPNATMELLVQREGSLRSARKLVNRVAAGVPAGEANRSAWVNDQITKWLDFAASSPPSRSAH
jgi:hypothetical protein